MSKLSSHPDQTRAKGPIRTIQDQARRSQLPPRHHSQPAAPIHCARLAQTSGEDTTAIRHRVDHAGREDILLPVVVH